jgi:hypothetical protein
MEKTNLIIGKYYLERPNIIIELSKKYRLFTTDIAYSECKCSNLSNVKILDFTADEMLQYTAFVSEHLCLCNIGFYEAGILFVAIHRKMMVAASDITTRQVCNELGIDTVEVNARDVIMSLGDDNDKGKDNLEISKLKKFIRAACL